MIRVERCGLLPPHRGGDVTRDQLRLAARYRNTLTEIERGRRAALREAEVACGLRDALAAVAAAEKAVEAALATAAAERAVTGSKRASAEVGAALKAARAALADARRAFAAKRAEVRTSVEAERERIDALASEIRKNARAHSGLRHGTYTLVEAAMDAAAKAPLWDGGAPNDPRFVRFTGEGAIGVQIPYGAVPGELEEHTLVRILPATPPPSELARWERKRARLNDPTWTPREGKGASRHRDLYLRVGSEGTARAPVWAVFPMVMHRPLPDGAKVKRAVVSVRRVGTREEWAALLTLDVPESSRAEDCGDGAVVVHLGWRVVDGGIRVAVTLDEHGRREEHIVTDEHIADLRVASGIESVRDKLFDRIRPILAGALRGVDGLTGRLAEDARTLHAWRSPDRLRRFVEAWTRAGAPGGDAPCDAASWREMTPEPARSRLPQGETVHAAAVAWLRHDRHLCDYAAGQRTGALRARRERYRVFAAGLARRYRVLVLDDTNRATLARRGLGEDDTTHDRAASNRHLVAVSELEGALKDAFRARGGEVVEVSSVCETITCHACGVRTEVGEARVAQCYACGVAWDQDTNAARNMLARYRERCGDGAETGAARIDENASQEGAPAMSTWQRRRAEAAARRAEKEAARKSA